MKPSVDSAWMTTTLKRLTGRLVPGGELSLTNDDLYVEFSSIVDVIVGMVWVKNYVDN
jgi:hypothetical protein